MTKISAVIITFNEERKIGRCIDSLRDVADEIVVIDSFSSDHTKSICLEKKVRFIEHAFAGYIEQKNFGVSQAQYDYILSLDGDECLSDELRASILIAKNDLAKNAYYMNRRNNFCGKWIYHCGWYPDRKLRLWNRKKGKWTGINPHDRVVMTGNYSSKKLKGDLLHYSFETVEEYKKQQSNFATIAAAELAARGKKTSRLLIYIKTIITFLRNYVLRLGFLDGDAGWVICTTSAQYTYEKYSGLLKQQQSVSRN